MLCVDLCIVAVWRCDQWPVCNYPLSQVSQVSWHHDMVTWTRRVYIISTHPCISQATGYQLELETTFEKFEVVGPLLWDFKRLLEGSFPAHIGKVPEQLLIVNTQSQYVLVIKYLISYSWNEIHHNYMACIFQVLSLCSTLHGGDNCNHYRPFRPRIMAVWWQTVRGLHESQGWARMQRKDSI